MRRIEVKGPPLSRQLVRDLAESSEGLCESGSSPFAIPTSKGNLTEGKIDPPDSLHRAGLVSSSENRGEIVPALPIVDDSIYHDLTDSDSSYQADSERVRGRSDSKNSSNRTTGISFCSQELEFDLDPR